MKTIATHELVTATGGIHLPDPVKEAPLPWPPKPIGPRPGWPPTIPTTGSSIDT